MFKIHTKYNLTLVFLILVGGLILVFQGLTSTPEHNHSSADETFTLRDVYYHKDNGSPSSIIGSLSIMLIEPTGSREVRLDHPFRSGDKFRFTVNSNQSGWLYILHRSPDGKTQLLWPQAEPDKSIMSHQAIMTGHSYLIPPSPGSFRFDEQLGEEEFIIAIRSEQKAPELDVPEITPSRPPIDHSESYPDNADPLDKKAPPKNPTTGNIVIRGDPFFGGKDSRGIYFDPGTEDPDQRIYFSALPGHASTHAILKFTLQHAK